MLPERPSIYSNNSVYHLYFKGLTYVVGLEILGKHEYKFIHVFDTNNNMCIFQRL